MRMLVNRAFLLELKNSLLEFICSIITSRQERMLGE